MYIWRFQQWIKINTCLIKYRHKFYICGEYMHKLLRFCRRIDSEQIRSRINQPLIAGRFGPKAFVSCVQNSFVRS